ncbi:hypothetical protein, partial [Klebsiella pneumoniae]|uniref:hypothetical protein n=1 Tax=Klebsiella pneumoniae TaxID=573 RepID=UPI003EE13FDE
LEVLEAIPVGADLSMVWPRQAIYLLDQVEQYDESGCCKAVKDLYSRLIRGETVYKNEWVAAADAARAAYYAA